MKPTSKEFCFCAIALGSQYREMAKLLANDLESYSPNTLIYIFTDNPREFDSQHNVIALKHHQQGIQNCYNDRRLLLERVFVDFPTAIQIDVDTRIIGNIPNGLEFPSGIIGFQKNLIDHVSKARPHSLAMMQTLAAKLKIPLENAQWVGEALFIVTRDGPKENEFFRWWEQIARYAELRGMHSGEGSLIGLAAAKVGWKIKSHSTWETLSQLSQHCDASRSVKRSSWQQFQRRIGYHYRLNKARLAALKDFDFYYR